MTNFSTILVFVLLFLVSCNSAPKKVFIIKQWHLAPNIDSTDIDKSKSLGQYQHQKAIYKLLKSKISEGYKTIIAEGCEGEIGKGFSKKFNGWDYEALNKNKKNANYEDIITLAPLKLKVIEPEAKVVCGDNYRLIKHNQLAMSDLRGHLGFYINIKTRKDPGYIVRVKEALKSLGHGEVNDVEGFLRKKLLDSWDTTFSLIHQRNDIFIDAIENQDTLPIVVIGGIHVKDLTAKLDAKGIAYEIATPIDYPIKDENMILSLSELMKRLRQ